MKPKFEVQFVSRVLGKFWGTNSGPKQKYPIFFLLLINCSKYIQGLYVYCTVHCDTIM